MTLKVIIKRNEFVSDTGVIYPFLATGQIVESMEKCYKTWQGQRARTRQG